MYLLAEWFYLIWEKSARWFLGHLALEDRGAGIAPARLPLHLQKVPTRFPFTVKVGSTRIGILIPTPGVSLSTRPSINY
jgi:hypothetical protein